MLADPEDGDVTDDLHVHLVGNDRRVGRPRLPVEHELRVLRGIHHGDDDRRPERRVGSDEAGLHAELLGERVPNVGSEAVVPDLREDRRTPSEP